MYKETRITIIWENALARYFVPRTSESGACKTADKLTSNTHTHSAYTDRLTRRIHVNLNTMKTLNKN